MERKRNVLGVNLRFLFMGGERYSPVHRYACTVIDRDVYYDETRIYQLQQPPVFVSNITLTYNVCRPNLPLKYRMQTDTRSLFMSMPNNHRKQAF